MDILGNIYNDSKALNYHKKFAMRMFDCIQERQMETQFFLKGHTNEYQFYFICIIDLWLPTLSGIGNP